MRKELTVAIIFGISIGIILSIGIWRFNKVFRLTKDNQESVSFPAPPSSKNEPQQEIKTALVKPEENEILIENPARVSGITKKGSLIAISTRDKDYILQTQIQENGEFSQDIELLPGLNQILLTMISKDGEKSEILRTVVYSSEFAKEIEPEIETKVATEAAESIINKVKEKIGIVKKNPTAYIGVITDKSQDSLQIKNTLGEIKLASIEDNASFVKLSKSSEKISFADIAIGDFVVAMGFLPPENKKDVLLAKRILVTDPPEDLKIKVIHGTILKITGRIVSLKEDEVEWQLHFPRRWEGPEIKELEVGDKLIAIGEPKDNTMTIRTIYVVP